MFLQLFQKNLILLYLLIPLNLHINFFFLYSRLLMMFISFILFLLFFSFFIIILYIFIILNYNYKALMDHSKLINIMLIILYIIVFYFINLLNFFYKFIHHFCNTYILFNAYLNGTLNIFIFMS